MTFGIFETIALLVVFAAYFVKGFSGFGPALILVPALTFLYDPETAISASTFFDVIAGPVLLFSVRKQIDWKLVIPVTLLIFVGAYFGAKLLKSVPTDILTKVIALGLLIFIGILLFQNHNDKSPTPISKRKKYLSLPISLLGGFSGGMIGITGPLLIIYMKLNYQKSYFRNQLIAVFTFDAIWRFFLYRVNGVAFNIGLPMIAILTLMMLGALWIGQHVHAQVNERNFNRIIALILLVPALNLLIFK